MEPWRRCGRGYRIRVRVKRHDMTVVRNNALLIAIGMSICLAWQRPLSLRVARLSHTTLSDEHLREFDFFDERTGLANDGRVLFRTNDGGISWTLLRLEGHPLQFQIADETFALAVLSTEAGIDRMVVSRDKGSSWRVGPQLPPVFDRSKFRGVWYVPETITFLRIGSVPSIRPDCSGVRGTDCWSDVLVMESLDRGRTWKEAYRARAAETVHSIRRTDEGMCLLTDTGGVFYSAREKVWRELLVKESIVNGVTTDDKPTGCWKTGDSRYLLYRNSAVVWMREGGKHLQAAKLPRNAMALPLGSAFLAFDFRRVWVSRQLVGPWSDVPKVSFFSVERTYGKGTLGVKDGWFYRISLGQ